MSVYVTIVEIVKTNHRRKLHGTLLLTDFRLLRSRLMPACSEHCYIHKVSESFAPIPFPPPLRRARFGENRSQAIFRRCVRQNRAQGWLLADVHDELPLYGERSAQAAHDGGRVVVEHGRAVHPTCRGCRRYPAYHVSRRVTSSPSQHGGQCNARAKCRRNFNHRDGFCPGTLRAQA